MMLFSDASGRKVVSTTTAETVGKIDDFIVDPTTRTILALSLKKTDGGEILHWSAIKAFGVDAVTVTDAGTITNADSEITALAGKDHRLRGKRVLTAAGDDIGSVDDVEFDPATGVITGLHLQQQHVDGARLRGVGSYAVVVESVDA